MTERVIAADEPDRVSTLLGRVAAGDPDGSAGRDLYVAVHEAVFPMCMALLGDPDTARDAEQETLRRLLEHLSRRDPGRPEIVHGIAYVRQVARNVCHDLGRHASDARRERAADVTSLGELPAPTLDPSIADMTPPSLGTARDHALRNAFGYRSKQLLEDIAGLSAKELRVLALRLQGMSYAEVAQQLGDGLTTATAQTQGERAMHHLRGRIHQRLWHQEPLGSWTMPHCPILAQLKTEVQRRLMAGAAVTTTLYRDIGKHLDPHPNRSRARGDSPACPTCFPELKRCEADYLWLLGTIPPVAGVLALDPPPAMQPTAHTIDAPTEPPPYRPTPPPGPPIGPGGTTGPGRAGPPDARRRRRGPRAALIVLVILVLVIIGGGVFVVRPLIAGENPLRALPFGLGGRSAPAPEACKLLTPGDVGGVLGEESGPCEQEHFTANQDDTYKKDRYDGVLYGTDLATGTPSFEVDITTYNFGTAKAARQQDVCTNPFLKITPVPNLGDQACLSSLNIGGLSAATQVLVIKGSVLLEIQLTRALKTATKDETIRLATIAVSRVG